MGDSTNQWMELMGCHMFPKNAKKTLAHSETIHDSLKQWCVTNDLTESALDEEASWAGSCHGDTRWRLHRAAH